MEKRGPDSSCLFTSAELANHIVDSLVDHGFIDKERFKEAIASVKWELDSQHGIGRIMLNAEAPAK
jgi:hypothetical protein